MTLERTLVFIKPGNSLRSKEIFEYLEDQLKRREIIFFERSAPIRIHAVPEKLIRKHYENIKGKSFYEPTLKAYLECSDGISLATYSGSGIIKALRRIIGDTDPKKAEPFTIRHIFGNDSFVEAYKEKRYLNNVIHASVSRKEAKRELNIWRDYINLK